MSPAVVAAVAALALSGCCAALEPSVSVAHSALELPVNVFASESGKYIAVQLANNALTVFTTSGKRLFAVPAMGVNPGISWGLNDKRLCVSGNGHLRMFVLPSGKSARTGLSEDSPNMLRGVADNSFAAEFKAAQAVWWRPRGNGFAYLETEFATANKYVKPGGTLPVFRLKLMANGISSTIAETGPAWPYLLRVAWHPDGQRLAFYRMNRLQTEAQLCLYELGQVRVILLERDKYWVNVPNTPLFIDAGRRMAITSERSGARHAYLCDSDGQSIVDLTPGDFEVTSVMAQENSLFALATTGNRQSQGLYHLDSSGAPRRVSSETGWRQVSMVSSGYAQIESSLRMAPSVTWHKATGHITQIQNSDITTVLNDAFFLISMHDGVQVPARAFRPADFNPRKKYPLIIYTHAGPGSRVVKDEWGGWQMDWNRWMTERGYVVVAVDARGSGGYGHLYEEYIHYRLGSQEVADLREVLNYLRVQTYVDSERIGIWGCDYGAQDVLHAMTEFPGGFRAGFADAPITEWKDEDAYFVERYLGLPSHRITEYLTSSPLEFVRRITGKLMVAAPRDGSDLIPAEHLAALKAAIARIKNKEVQKRFLVLEMDAPGYRYEETGLALLMSKMAEFFDSQLSSSNSAQLEWEDLQLPVEPAVEWRSGNLSASSAVDPEDNSVAGSRKH